MKRLPLLFKKATSILVLSSILMSASMTSLQAKDSDYVEGQKQLDQRNWLKAEKTFRKVASQKGSKQDAAFYWLAYAQSKNNQTNKALSTLKHLKRKFPKSKWIDDAEALHAEIKDKQGESADISDDELKLYAIDSLLQSSSERTTKILAKIIRGDNTDQVKKRAMFVLSQSDHQDSYKLMSELAADEKNSTTQLYAIQTLGVSGSEQAIGLLEKIYKETKHEEVKHQIVKSLMVANESDMLVSLAREEKKPELKEQAIKMLGVMGNSQVLLGFYNDASFAEQKGNIINSLAIGGGVEQLESIIKTEENSQYVIEAVKKLGIISADDSGKILSQIYSVNSDREIKFAVIQAMFIQSNAKGLIAILQAEKDNEIKRKALRSLSMIDSHEVVEFFSKSLN